MALRHRTQDGALLQIGPLSMTVQYWVENVLHEAEFQYTDRERKQFVDWLYEYSVCDDLYIMDDFITEATRPQWFATSSSSFTISFIGMVDSRDVTINIAQREAENLANAINQQLLFTPDEYQRATSVTAAYHETPLDDLAYLGLGIAGEAGEVADKLKKLFRDSKGLVDNVFRDEMEKEIGDVQWYVAQLALMLDLSLEQVMRANLLKLQSRKERGVIHGAGDER